MSKVNIVEAPSFIDYILYKNDSTIEIYTNNVPAIWLLDETPNANVGYSFGQVLANIFQNYVDAWNAAPFSKYYLNTIFVASATTILEIIFASMAAFAFSKLNFWGKDFIFITFLATMMIPGEVLLVPNYITISRFSWIDSYYALIVPWVISVFAIFLIRQQFMTVPNELWDAAKIDGSSSWRFLWTVMVPLSKPAVMTGALLKFVGSWNAFLWVLIVTKSPEMRTLSVGLQNFRTDAGEIYNLLMAASTFTMIPIVILFLFLQRYFIEGIARTGLKG
ncbi:ABC transporter permease [Petrotoga sp. 9PW.55.5.1]|nr:ABC transporter permease [Petrotoga sp. 9PW.55.5.1]